jgi:hypothetical protein
VSAEDPDDLLLAAIEQAEVAAREALAATLACCAADRRVVNRHRPVAADGPDRCGHCGAVWPCPDLLDRCAAYAVLVES